jgi:hypothetical protein
MPGPMALFRRKRGEKEEAAERPGAPGTTSSPSEEATRPDPHGGSAPLSVPPSGSPPPLPQPPPGSSPTGASAQKFARCFVCGSTLDSGTCPQCKIAWVE